MRILITQIMYIKEQALLSIYYYIYSKVRKVIFIQPLERINRNTNDIFSEQSPKVSWYT